MAIKRGQEYIDRVDAAGIQVWIDGQRVSGKISEHPALSGVMQTQAKLYDLQHEPSIRQLMTYTCPSTNQLVGTSFMQPKTKHDLSKRRKMIQTWANQCGGLLGRSPDYMNTVVMTLGVASPLFAEQENSCAEQIRQYYEYARNNDITLTHTFVNPQVNRSKSYTEPEDKIISARMIEKNNKGLMIHGARMLATQGGITDEILVLPSNPSALDYLLEENNPYAYAFAIPNNTPGLKFICRESLDYGKSHYDHPLGSRYEEMDTLVIFDHVQVPWERVFISGNTFMLSSLYQESSYYAHVGHQVVSKNVVKTEFILGVAQMLAESIKITEYQHVQEKIAEVILALETMKSFLAASETNATLDKWGTMTPDITPLHAAMVYYPRIYPRFMEILQLLGGSGLMTIPTEADFNSELHAELNHYLQGAQLDGYERVKLFRLAWDLCMSAFGARQTLYERFFFGDPIKQACNLYSGYNKEKYLERVKEFLTEAKPLKSK